MERPQRPRRLIRKYMGYHTGKVSRASHTWIFLLQVWKFSGIRDDTDKLDPTGQPPSEIAWHQSGAGDHPPFGNQPVGASLVNQANYCQPPISTNPLQLNFSPDPILVYQRAPKGPPSQVHRQNLFDGLYLGYHSSVSGSNPADERTTTSVPLSVPGRYSTFVLLCHV